ncbi:Oxidoreductase htatip2 [Geranomyces variabilis]|nr:Oxidoreductase htatip2 [Geranomyces variabilis]
MSATPSPASPAALVMGATGAVGKALIRELLADSPPAYSKVTAIVRKELDYDGPNRDRLVQKIVDFENLEKDKAVFAEHDTMYCTFGTTKAAAGSAAAFEKIDRDYVLSAAKLFHTANSATTTTSRPLQFLYCSSGGANARSWFLYMRVKGEIEEAVKSMGFNRVGIFRPAFLVVEESRGGQKRVAESLLHPVMDNGVARWMGLATPVGAVARAMKTWALKANAAAGNETLEHKDIMAASGF